MILAGFVGPGVGIDFLVLVKKADACVAVVAGMRPGDFANATSLDGCIARRPGERTELTSAAANRHAHGVRAEVDAIGVGVGTILCDDPLLTARGVYREEPLIRVIFDRRLRTPASARVLSTRGAGPSCSTSWVSTTCPENA